MHKILPFILLVFSCTAQAIPLKIQHFNAGQDKAQNILVMLHDTKSDPKEFANLAGAFTARGFYPVAIDFRASALAHWRKTHAKEQWSEYTQKKDFPTPSLFYSDVVSTLKNLRTSFPGKQIVLAASGDMAEQSLRVARDYPSIVDGLFLFTPEFSSDELELKLSSAVRVPLFVTASDDTTQAVVRFVASVKTKKKMAYLPEGPSTQGAFALQSNTQEKELIWQALDDFIRLYFPMRNRQTG